jgi:hypothetical protein
MIHCVLISTPSVLYNDKWHCLITLTWTLVETHINSQQTRKQRNTTKRGALNCSIHKVTYSAVSYRVMCVSITATHHTSLNISNIRLKIMLWGDNNINIFYISKSPAAFRRHGFWPYLALDWVKRRCDLLIPPLYYPIGYVYNKQMT